MQPGMPSALSGMLAGLVGEVVAAVGWMLLAARVCRTLLALPNFVEVVSSAGCSILVVVGW